MKQITRIVAISGSLKSTSANTNILWEMAKIAPENVIVNILEGLDQLPHFNPEIIQEITAVTDFRNQIKAADGVIFSTPEYAFGVPGVLKNALDWLVSSGELNGKAVAAISVSPLHTGGGKGFWSFVFEAFCAGV